MQTPDWIDITLPAGLALLFGAMGWSWARGVNGGDRLNPSQRSGLLYGFVFVLGTGYIMFFIWLFQRWSNDLVLGLIAAWGLLLGLVALLRYKKRRAQSS